MPLFIFLFWYFCYIEKITSENALLFDLTNEEPIDVACYNDDEELPPCLTACPATTPQEVRFNKEISMSGNSLFSRNVYNHKECRKNIQIDICEKPIKSATVTIEATDWIGYELYYEDGKIASDGFKWHWQFVNYEKNTINETQENYFVMKYDDKGKTKFYFTDGSPTLVYFWTTVFKISHISKSTLTRFIEHKFRFGYADVSSYLTDKCEDYNAMDENIEFIFAEKNQAECLKDILIPLSLSGSNAEISCGQSYGCLEKSQIKPLWYFDESPSRIASCASANIIPVWKSIADAQLKKVDRYIYSVAKYLDGLIERPVFINFGVSGVLEMKKISSPDTLQEVYLADGTHHQNVSIPKIIYRAVVWYIREEYYYHFEQNAVIIIHNDPSIIPDSERLCNKEEELRGWNKISNEDYRTGLTYVCPRTDEIEDMLGMRRSSTDFIPLNLDMTYDINKNFQDSCLAQ